MATLWTVWTIWVWELFIRKLSLSVSCYVGCESCETGSVFPARSPPAGPVRCPHLRSSGGHPLPGGLQEQTQALHGQEDGPLLLLLREIKVRRLESKLSSLSLMSCRNTGGDWWEVLGVLLLSRIDHLVRQIYCWLATFNSNSVWF